MSVLTWLLAVCLLDFLVQISQSFQLKPIRTGLTQTVTSDPSFAYGTGHLQNLAPVIPAVKGKESRLCLSWSLWHVLMIINSLAESCKWCWIFPTEA